MNPKSFLSKTTSVVASLLLAVGGSLVATQPAAAAGTASFTFEDASKVALTGTPKRVATSTDFYMVMTVTCSSGTISAGDVGALAITPGMPYTLSGGAALLDDNSPATAANATDVGLYQVNATTVQYRKRLTSLTPTSGFSEANLNLTVMMNPKNTLSFCGVQSGIGGGLGASAPTITPPLYTVTLSANQGVSGAVTSRAQTLFGSAISLPNPSAPGDVPTRSGYSFAGWSTNPSATAGSYTYTPNADTVLYAAWMASGGGGGGGSTCVIGGVTQTAITSVTSNQTNLTSSGSYQLVWNGDATLNSCSLPLNANFGIIYLLNGAQIGNTVWNTSVSSITMNSAATTYATLMTKSQFTGVTVHDGDIYKIRYFFGSGSQPTISSTPTFEITMNLYPGGVVSGGNNTPSTAVVERYVAPVPALQAPIMNALAPKMSSGFSSTGGRLILKDVKPSEIASVTLNGVPVTVLTTKSGTAIKIPAGAKSGDLKFTMADGTVVDVADAVKVTPSQVNSNLVDLIPLPASYKSANSVAVPTAIKAAIEKKAGIIAQSDMAKCVGYASSSSAAAVATARSRASNVCGVITDINEAIDPIIKVVVNKIASKKTPVKYQSW